MRQDDSPFFGHPDPFPFSIYRAKSGRASDGDSGSLLVEVKRNAFELIDYRLSTIDTYELHKGPAEWQRLGAEALIFAQARIANTWLRLISILDTEKYGRTLMAIEYRTPAGNWLDLADRLRFAGYEKPRVAPAVRRARRILAAVRRA